MTFRNPPTGDLADMARIIQQTVAEAPDGIIYNFRSSANRYPLRSTRIPVMTMNTGTAEQSKKLGALLHVGQPEFEAGKGAGEKAKAAGIKSFLCVNSLFPNVAGEQRCKGFAAGLGVELGKQMIDSGTDATEIANRVKAYLAANTQTQAVLTLGPMTAIPTIKALKDNGQAGRIFFATFDLNPDISRAIKEGVINFAIDQQPFLQGYLPVITLTNYVRYGVVPASSTYRPLGSRTKMSRTVGLYCTSSPSFDTSLTPAAFMRVSRPLISATRSTTPAIPTSGRRASKAVRGIPLNSVNSIRALVAGITPPTVRNSAPAATPIESNNAWSFANS